MRFVSTRGDAPVLSFSDAILAGLARDGGLYLPETWPQFSPLEIAAFAGENYASVAASIVAPFAAGCLTRDEILVHAKGAYGGFRHSAITPLVQTSNNRFVLELFHGPTLAFKDLAMQLLARLMDHILEQRGERATIVGATSGDTGGAAVEAFRGSKRVDVVILFPEGRVSDVQRRMMTTPVEPNVHAASVAGDFDDCQALVKAMFIHHSFRDRVRLAGVNSINFARILAQTVYYFTSAVALGAPHRRVSYCVPTGNFGDIFAGYAAKRMGLPVDRLIAATNENDILARALSTGEYSAAPVKPTMSPSMDIQVSSNFERLLFEATDRDPASVKAMMAGFAQSRSFAIPERALHRIREEFDAGVAGEPSVEAIIKLTRAECGYLLDPHTAVAYDVAVRNPGQSPMVTLATAHPAKFPDTMQKITGERPKLPAYLAGLMAAPERITRLPNDIGDVERFVEANARAIKGAAA